MDKGYTEWHAKERRKETEVQQFMQRDATNVEYGMCD